jgi:hypothetical protein
MDKARFFERLKLYTKRTLIVLGVFLGVALLFALMGAGTLAVNEWNARRDTPEHRRSAYELAQAWGQLAPLPVKLEALEFKVDGRPFMHVFHLSFEADPALIDLWVRRSAGLAGLRRPAGAKGHSGLVAHGADGKGDCAVTWSQGGRRIDLNASWN